MFKRIRSLLRQDFTNALRDNILLYMMAGPIFLAIGARFFIPSVDEARLTFALQAGLSEEVVQQLEYYGDVLMLPSEEEVRERVNRSDDVPGLIGDEQGYRLVLEGNEAEGPEALNRLLTQILRGKSDAVYTVTSQGDQSSLLKEYTTIIFVMIGSLLGALVMAFNIIEDKETNAIRALGVSPLSMIELTLARGVFAILLGFFITVVSSYVLLGSRVPLDMLMIGFLFCTGIPVLTGYIIGGLADNQLKAIAILKFFMLIYLTLPIVSVFVPRQWHFFFYILPNYWMWTVYENVFIGSQGQIGFWWAGLITLAFSAAGVLVLLPLLRRQLKLR